MHVAKERLQGVRKISQFFSPQKSYERKRPVVELLRVKK